MTTKQSVQLCQNNLSDGSKTFDVLIHERTFGEPGELDSRMTTSPVTIQVSPANRNDCEDLIEDLVALGGMDRDPMTERSY